MKIHAGDSSPDRAPWLGSPVEVDSDQIETLIENRQHYTTWEVAGILKIPKSSIDNFLHQLGYYVSRFDVWVLRKLSEKNLDYISACLSVTKTFHF